MLSHSYFNLIHIWTIVWSFLFVKLSALLIWSTYVCECRLVGWLVGCFAVLFGWIYRNSCGHRAHTHTNTRTHSYIHALLAWALYRVFCLNYVIFVPNRKIEYFPVNFVPPVGTHSFSLLLSLFLSHPPIPLLHSIAFSHTDPIIYTNRWNALCIRLSVCPERL